LPIKFTKSAQKIGRMYSRDVTVLMCLNNHSTPDFLSIYCYIGIFFFYTSHINCVFTNSNLLGQWMKYYFIMLYVILVLFIVIYRRKRPLFITLQTTVTPMWSSYFVHMDQTSIVRIRLVVSVLKVTGYRIP